jgi:amino acid transporter
MLGIAMLIYFNVSGGPFFSEDVVGAAGPLFAILGFFFVAIFYSVPSALLTAEMGTTFPEDAGVVAWITAAFGPRWGFTQGVLFWFQGAIALAAYPLVLVSYLRFALCPDGGGTLMASMSREAHHCDALDSYALPFLPSNSTMICTVFVLFASWLNWRGLKLVGGVTVALVVILLLPFVVLCGLGVPKMRPSEWLVDKPVGAQSWTDIQWLPLLNTLVWCLNYWDSASTLVGETEQAETVLPKVMGWIVVFTFATYVVPILVCTAALPGQTWSSGFWVQAGYELGGAPLQWCIFGSALLSFTGQFLSGQATVAYELYGMAELGQVPICFLQRNSNGVPIWSLGLSILVVMLVTEVCQGQLGPAIAMCNGVYSIAEILTYGAFLWLRWEHPGLRRPFRIPIGFAGCAAMLICPFFICTSLIVTPFWAGEWWVAGAILVGASAMLLHSVIAWVRGYFPEAFLTERQMQSDDKECSMNTALSPAAVRGTS